MNVLIAFDRFTGSASSAEASLLAQEVLVHLHPNWTIHTLPLADGGRDFVKNCARVFHAETQVEVVLGSTFQPVKAEFLKLPVTRIPAALRVFLNLPPSGEVGFLEAAQTCSHTGNTVEAHPRKRSSIGLGKQIGKRADEGVSTVVIGLDDCSTVDGGLGALEAIGLEAIHDKTLGVIPRLLPEHWEHVLRFNGEVWPHIPRLITVSRNQGFLLGPNGAVARAWNYYDWPAIDQGPYEKLLGTLCKRLCDSFGKQRIDLAEAGGGAGGGLGFALATACDAAGVDGIDFARMWLNLKERVSQADMVITGCSRLDLHALREGWVGQVLETARKAGKHSFVLGTTLAAGTPVPPKTRLHEIAPFGTTLEKVRDDFRRLFAQCLRRAFGS